MIAIEALGCLLIVFAFRGAFSNVSLSVPLHWIGNTPEQDKAVSFGVPFDEGYLFPETSLRLKTDRNQEIPVDTWPLAYWPDGSVKWSGVAGVIPAGTVDVWGGKHS